MTQPTPDAKVAAVQGRMAELAAKFLHRSSADVATLRTQLERLESGAAEALGEIRHLAHRMVGTGATLGFEAISERASRIEQLAERVEPGTVPDGESRAALTAALDALTAEVNKLRGS
jgi:HPt (histidine-containing phosphotransfer) domain-containing protein